MHKTSFVIRSILALQSIAVGYVFYLFLGVGWGIAVGASLFLWHITKIIVGILTAVFHIDSLTNEDILDGISHERE